MPAVKTASQRPSLFSALNALAEEITSEKTAAAVPPNQPGQVKQAGPTPSDPGGYQGASSHPSAQIDNNVQNSSEGSRSSENESDVKEDQGAPGVNSAAEVKPGDSQQNQLNIGMTQSPTGEDASVEDDYKGDKDDPGTTHPAKASVGEKYSSVSLKDGIDTVSSLSNAILADLANGFGDQLSKTASLPGAPMAGAASAPAAPAAPAATAPIPAAAPAAPATPSLGAQISKAAQVIKDQQTAQQATQAEEQAGYELATLLGIDKAAAQQNVQYLFAESIRDGRLDGDLFGSYYNAFLAKQAASDDGGKDPEPPPDEGGGDMGGGGGGGEMTLPPPGGGAPGGLPAGGPPGGGDPSGGGAPPSEDEALQELAMALQELGIPLDALAAAGAAGGGAGGPPPGAGGPPPGAGGMPPGGGAPPMPPGGGGEPAGMKLASAVRRFQQSGKFEIKAAQTQRQRELRNSMKNYVREIMGMG